MKTRLLLIFSATLFINFAIMYHNLYGQMNWNGLGDIEDGSFYVARYNNFLLLEGIVYNNNIPDWNKLISYDPSCIQLVFEPENLWVCKNRQYSELNSESFRYWLMVKKLKPECDACITIVGHPEYGKICFNDSYQVHPHITNECGLYIENLQNNNIDEFISFEVILTYNTNPEFPSEPPLGLIGEISSRFGQTQINMDRTSYIPPNQAVYSTNQLFKARDLLNGDITHRGNIKFSASYINTGAVSGHFAEFPSFFDVDSLAFINTIDIIEGLAGYQKVCLPYGSNVALGNRLIIDAGGWPFNCPVDAVLSTFISGGNRICDQDIILQKEEANTIPSATSLDLPGDGNHGHEFIYYMNHKMSIEGGPERELPNEEKVGIYNGFAGGNVTSEDVPASRNMAKNGVYHLRVSPHPNLVTSERFTYSWHYTFTPNEPGPILSEDSIIFTPDSSILKETTIELPDATGTGVLWYNCRDLRTGEASQSAHYEFSIGNELVINSPLKDSTYWISPTPEMPSIPFKAQLSNVPDSIAKTLTYSWHIAIVYRDDAHGTDSVLFSGETQDSIWTPKWGDTFAGGAVVGKVEVRYQDSTYKAELAETLHVRILGKNIEGNRGTTVNSYIDGLTNFNAIVRSAAKGAACYETENYSQFYDTTNIHELPDSLIGYPIRGGAGRGIMQLDFHAFVNHNSQWNWKANVGQGLVCCQERRQWALDDFNLLKPGSTPTDEQLCKQILVKYNGNRYSEYYKLSSDSSFIRPDSLCVDCGSCDTGNNGLDRNGEHYKNDTHKTCTNSNPCILTRQCYADGAYSCSH